MGAFDPTQAQAWIDACRACDKATATYLATERAGDPAATEDAYSVYVGAIQHMAEVKSRLTCECEAYRRLAEIGEVR